MTEPTREERPRPLLPARLEREQQAFGLILSLISRSLAISLVAAAAYFTWLTW